MPRLRLHEMRLIDNGNSRLTTWPIEGTIRANVRRKEVNGMTKSQPFKPGQRDARSGQYVPVGPRGGQRGKEEITHVKGEPLPPTKETGEQWQLVDPTKHKGD